MTPEDVPAELVGLAADALIAVDYPADEWPEGPPGEGERDHAHELAAAALAAVLPEHEKQVRAKVAEQIADVRPAGDDEDTDYVEAYWDGRDDGARIARGEA